MGPLPNSTIVQVNVPSWRSLIYGEKLAQAGRTQISLADAKATLVVNPSKDLSLQVEEGGGGKEAEEESKGGPIGKFLSVYKSSVPLHVDPSFTFSFGSGEDSNSNGERARSVKVVDAVATNSRVDVVIMEKGVSSSKHDITSTLASNEEKVNKPVEPLMDPAERWLSHRPETKRKKEEQQMNVTINSKLIMPKILV